MLYIISTPIGNLGDISFRAVETLKNCSAIFCEDTRQSRILMERYEIKTPLFSYHKFNEKGRADEIVARVKSGESVGLISDAGTPLISDPGSILIETFIQEGLPYTAVPGPSALIDALVLSGISATRFQFIGFLPKIASELAKELSLALQYPGTTIAYDSPHRILETLDLLEKLSPNRKLAIGRELTKKFEEILKGTAAELKEKLHGNPRGELVLLIQEVNEESFSNLSPKEHVALLMQTFEIDEKSALRLAAELRGVQKRTLYKEFKNF